MGVQQRRRREAVGVLGLLALLTSHPGSSAGAAEVRFYDPDGGPLPFRSYEEVEEFLASAEIVWKEKLDAGTNKEKRKVLLQQGDARAHAILRTGYEIKNTPGGGFVDSYQSELAAYALARLLGLDNVPPVVRRGRGSLQIWIENATTDAERRRAGEAPPDPQAFERQLLDLRVFDSLIANTDRNPGNIILDDQGRVWFIDHTRSFAGQTELRYADRLDGCSRQLWRRLQGTSNEDIRAAVGPYVKTYLRELLVRRDLLLTEITARIESRGEAEFLFGSVEP